MIPAKATQENPGSGSVRSQPNIVLVVADDLGYSDLGCYGGEIQTPNLDRLAAGGLRFTQFYNAAVCVPTRLALLTGLYPQQAGHVQWPDDTVDLPAEGAAHVTRGPLNDQCATIAELLGEASYRCYMAGKWQLNDAIETGPISRGFNRFFGLLSGGSNYFKLSPGRVMALDETPYTPPSEGFYITDAFTDHAISFLDEHERNSEDSPFFLYLPYTAPHWPLHALPEDIDRYRGAFLAGWDELRERRFERIKAAGLANAGWELTPRDERAPPWDEVQDKEGEALRMAVYAAQVDRLDQGIGRVLSKIDRMGKREDTLVLFLSDNGANAANVYQREEGAAARGIPPGPAESFMSNGLPWGNLSNTPFRFFKQWVHEGGICTPLIVSWPSGIEKRGAVTRQPGHIIDIMATFLDVAGIDYPESFKGRGIHPIEGKSLLPVLRGEQRTEHDYLFFHNYGNFAVRGGHWKLVNRNSADIQHFKRWEYPSIPHEGKWELYNLATDRTEMKDLSGDRPDKVAELQTALYDWMDRTGIRRSLSSSGGPAVFPRSLGTGPDG